MDFAELILQQSRGEGNPLVPELEACLIQTQRGFALQHPVLFEFLYSPALHPVYNANFQGKREIYFQLKQERAWQRLYFLVERPFRMIYLHRHAPVMTDAEYWENLGWCYRDSENIDQHLDPVREMLLSPRPERHLLMDEEDRATLAEMPERLTIYKGFSDSYHWASDFSFSTSLRVATWFAKRYGEQHPRLLVATVLKSQVLAYMTDRNEHEILVNPDHVEVQLESKLCPQGNSSDFVAQLHQGLNRHHGDITHALQFDS